MSFWGQLNFQEGMSVPMELLSYFHDYMMMILLFILVFVSYMFYAVSSMSYYNFYFLDSHVLETIWTIVPIIILLFMAFPSLYLLYLMEEVSSPAITVKVVGHQWYWEYQYSNSWFSYSMDSYMTSDTNSDFASLHSLDVDNRLLLPVSASILFLVTSADVLHSWTVPTLGIKVDAIPGRMNYLTTITPSAGVYYGQCSEICGSNHSFMPIVLEFVSMEDYLQKLTSLA